MRLLVKICGMANAEDVAAIEAMHPDAMGFVFWKGSPRYAIPEDVAVWTRMFPTSILKVGVFVDSTAEEISQIVETAGLDVVQLHGFQTLEKNRENFPMFGKNSRKFSRVWKVVRLDRGTPMGDEPVDAYLLDSYSPGSPGGTGKTLDWNAAAEFVQSTITPVILAGGLTPENVAEACRQVKPWGVDVNSGVEKQPGKKDIKKVREFIARCRKL